MNLTAANQLTILRMLLIPAFVILLLYGYRGWALVSFFIAGITDLLDGLIARRDRAEDDARRVARSDGGQAAAGDDVRDADAAGHRLREPAAALVHGPRDQPRRRDRADGGGREPGGRAADVPAVDLRKDCDGDVRRHRAW